MANDKIKNFLKNKTLDELKPHQLEKALLKSNKIELTDAEKLEIVEMFRNGKSIPEVKKEFIRELDTGKTHNHDHPNGKFKTGDPIISKLSGSTKQIKEIYDEWQEAIAILETEE